MSTKDPKSIPNEDTLAQAAELEIFDAEGRKIKFGSLFNRKSTIVVFIRHFFCGSCQQYVEALGNIPNESLKDADVELVVIGCGEYQPIKAYAENTHFNPGRVYADPTRKLYHVLGMDTQNLQVTPAGQKRPSYLKMGRISSTIMSLARAFKKPNLIGKHGDISQLGGEFIFGPGNKCLFASRMQHTEDHVEVFDLFKEAGVIL